MSINENDALDFLDSLARRPSSFNFSGIPVVIDPYMPEDQVWLVQQGKKETIHIHEGQSAGQTVEVWITKPKIVKIINLGPDPMRPKTPYEFHFETEK